MSNQVIQQLLTNAQHIQCSAEVPFDAPYVEGVRNARRQVCSGVMGQVEAALGWTTSSTKGGTQLSMAGYVIPSEHLRHMLNTAHEAGFKEGVAPALAESDCERVILKAVDLGAGGIHDLAVLFDYAPAEPASQCEPAIDAEYEIHAIYTMDGGPLGVWDDHAIARLLDAHRQKLLDEDAEDRAAQERAA